MLECSITFIVAFFFRNDRDIYDIKCRSYAFCIRDATGNDPVNFKRKNSILEVHIFDLF